MYSSSLQFPDEASEPTSTIVLTTPSSRHFVDLRFFKPSPVSAPLTTLEWGTAGRSVGTPTHGKWIHSISSRSTHPADETDEGTMAPHPSLPDVDIERGRMAHLDTGEVREYEEAWKAVRVLPTSPGRAVAVWLEMRGEGEVRRGTVVRVGQYCQGIVRDGAEVSVQRWLWAEAGGWGKVGSLGGFDIPCDATWAGVLREGDVVQRGGAVWDVKEVALL